jgi:hypothetical protein
MLAKKAASKPTIRKGLGSLKMIPTPSHPLKSE